jgi:glycosyltransferase involved in cell wall biosynthesis
MPHLSIISPVYKTGTILPELVRQLEEVLEGIKADYEIILVDDGSPDESWDQLAFLCRQKKYITGLKLSRNFGQSAALAAGLVQSKGDWVVLMDSDLQDVPLEISRLYNQALAGYDIVTTKRRDRTDGLFRKTISYFFNFLLMRWSGMKSDLMISNFGIYSRRVVDEVLSMKENARFFPMMIYWTGFPRTSIDVSHGIRLQGKSGYNLGKLIRLAINTTISYSDKPLRYVVKMGLAISLLSFLAGMITLIRYFRKEILVSGYTSLILSIWFLSGLILFTLGVVGMYVGKTFEETKGRPLFVIEKTIN